MYFDSIFFVLINNLGHTLMIMQNTLRLHQINNKHNMPIINTHNL